MAWTQIASDIPMTDWSSLRGIHAVAVRDQVYLFGYHSSGGSDTLEVRAFHPRACTWSALPPLAGEVGTRAPGGEVARVHFAVASKEKVFVCVGADEMKVFDTRTSRWNRATTSGDVEFGMLGVHACVLHGHVYMCHKWLIKQSHLWALDLCSLRWEVVSTWDRSGETCFVQGLFSYENRLYVPFRELSAFRWNCTYDMRHFDLVTRRWKDVDTYVSSVDTTHISRTFIHGGKLFHLLGFTQEDCKDLPWGPIRWDEYAMEYSFATNKWAQVKFKGKAPYYTFNLVCVVDHMAVSLSCEDNKVCVLDFSFSLRNLCIEAVHKYQLDISLLPPILQKELKHYNLQSYDVQ